MVTVFGILNLTEDSFFDESRRLDPAGAVTAAIEMLRVGSDVVDVGYHPVVIAVVDVLRFDNSVEWFSIPFTCDSEVHLSSP